MDLEAAVLMGLPGLVPQGSPSTLAQDFLNGDYVNVLKSERAVKVWTEAGLAVPLPDQFGRFSCALSSLALSIYLSRLYVSN
jgi:hypothetical protein